MTMREKPVSTRTPKGGPVHLSLPPAGQDFLKAEYIRVCEHMSPN